MNSSPAIRIKRDNDVPVSTALPCSKRGRPVDPETQALVDEFARFKAGHSFFVEGAASKDLEYLRKPFTRAGLGVLIRRVEHDEKYKTAGVRVWRLAGDYDEL